MGLGAGVSARVLPVEERRTPDGYRLLRARVARSQRGSSKDDARVGGCLSRRAHARALSAAASHRIFKVQIGDGRGNDRTITIRTLIQFLLLLLTLVPTLGCGGDDDKKPAPGTGVGSGAHGTGNLAGSTFE